MKKNSFSRRLAAFLMTFAMLVSLTNGFSAARVQAADSDDTSKVSWEQVENEGRGRLAEAKKTSVEEPKPEFADDEMVRVSIVLTEAGTIAKGYDAATIESNASAKSYRQSLRQKQDALASQISKEVLGGKALDVVIPSGVTAIAPFALCSCHNITSVTIPSSITSITSPKVIYQPWVAR